MRGALAWAILSVALAAHAGAPVTRPADRSDAAIVLEIQRLLDGDPTLSDPAQRSAALRRGLRKVPTLIAELERNFPDSRYRQAACGMALDALVVRRELGDKTVTGAHIAAAARRLLAMATDDEYRAKARFALLESELIEALGRAGAGAAASMPASAPATQAVARRQLEIARKFVALAEDLPATGHAPPALYLGGGLYLQGGRESLAVGVYGRLTRNYPKDPCSLKALMILVQLHTRAGRGELALAAKRRCVDHFGDSEAAAKYRADIARAEGVGKPFFLRFRSARGRRVDVTRHKGKTVLVYFYVSLLRPPMGGETLRTMSDLAKLAAETKCVLLAVGADDPAKTAQVARALEQAKISAPNLLDPQSKVAAQYGVLMVPSVVVVDPAGRLRSIVTAADIVPAVRKVVAPAPNQPAPRKRESPKPPR